jgi:hypothetical protein
MTEIIAAKKAAACVSDRVYVSHPAETAVLYLKDNQDGEVYECWLATVASEDQAQEDCGSLELANGEFFVYADGTYDLAIKLVCEARRLYFKYLQVIDLTEDPVKYSVTEL